MKKLKTSWNERGSHREVLTMAIKPFGCLVSSFFTIEILSPRFNCGEIEKSQWLSVMLRISKNFLTILWDTCIVFFIPSGSWNSESQMKFKYYNNIYIYYNSTSDICKGWSYLGKVEGLFLIDPHSSKVYPNSIMKSKYIRI